MTSKSEQPCAVCGRQTKSTCGGCRSVYFCSRDCQAAVRRKASFDLAWPNAETDMFCPRQIWSAHKWLCKNSPGTFTFPPLTTDEAATLKELVGRSDAVIATAMKRVKLGERDGWRSGKYEVCSPLSQESSRSWPVLLT